MNIFVFLSMLASVGALFSPSDGVVDLNPSNFHQKVVESDELWLVEFYAPWCGHCKSLAPEWAKAAKALKGVVRVGAVDADAHGGLGGQYGVQGFPTIKIFGANKFKPEDYQGGRTAADIVNSAMSKAKSMVTERLTGKSGGGGGRSGGGSQSGGQDEVVELTDANFEKLVFGSKDLWLVEFFAPWCGHCKNLAPHWKSAASDLKGKAKLGAYDATANSVFAQRYQVRGYPTIKMFPAGDKDQDSATDYDGGRTSGDIVRWVEERVVEDIPPPEVHQITSAEMMKTECEDHQICILSILPHILDCQSKCRNKYINILKTAADGQKKKKWGYVWAEAGAQPKLEEGVGIGGFGYPAMVAINKKKNIYVVLKGPFSDTGIKEFLRDLSYGKGAIVPIRDGVDLSKIDKQDPWDGKDGEMPVEEDYGDLDDIELDDLSKDEL